MSKAGSDHERKRTRASGLRRVGQAAAVLLCAGLLALAGSSLAAFDGPQGPASSAVLRAALTGPKGAKKCKKKHSAVASKKKCKKQKK